MTNSVSRKDGDIGHDPVLVNYGGVLHSFHYSATGGNLRHARKTPAGWRFEDLDGTSGSICGKNANLGKNPVALVHNGTLQVFAYDEGNKDLRHYWSDQTGWHCETLEGDPNAVLGNGETGGEVGAMPSFVSLNGQLHGLAKETKYGSLRHYWTDASGWHAENFDGLGGNPAGRVGHSTGDDPVTIRFGTTPQFFWHDNTKGNLRHSIPN